VIPGATDTAKNIRGIGNFISANLHGAVARWELCAFNNLCRDKYKRLSMDWPFADQELPERSLMEELSLIAKSTVEPSIVCWSGSTKLDAKDYHSGEDSIQRL
jgi:pyruvate formate lyase activating enzyme